MPIISGIFLLSLKKNNNRKLFMKINSKKNNKNSFYGEIKKNSKEKLNNISKDFLSEESLPMENKNKKTELINKVYENNNERKIKEIEKNIQDSNLIKILKIIQLNNNNEINLSIENIYNKFTIDNEIINLLKDKEQLKDNNFIENLIETLNININEYQKITEQTILELIFNDINQKTVDDINSNKKYINILNNITSKIDSLNENLKTINNINNNENQLQYDGISYKYMSLKKENEKIRLIFYSGHNVNPEKIIEYIFSFSEGKIQLLTCSSGENNGGNINISKIGNLYNQEKKNNLPK